MYRTSSPLKLKLFGAPTVEGPEGPLQGRGVRGQRLALLAVLATARGGSLTRDKVLSVLWPEADTERGRRQLSDALYLLRGALGDEAVVASGDELRLNVDRLTSDVETFERLLDERDYESAVTLYHGPLLDGFHLADAVQFERWLDGERARLADRFAGAVGALAEASERRSDWAAAVPWLRRLAAHDPYVGRTAIRLMRAHQESGNRAAALQHARVYATLLRNEFDAEPDAEVAALVERLKADAPVEPSRSSEPPRQGLTSATSPAEVPAVANPTRAGMTVDARADFPSAPTRLGVDRVGRHMAQRLVVVAIVALVSLGAMLFRHEARAFFATGVANADPIVVPKRSIAVLPFNTLGPSTGDQYFSDGLTEEVIGLLSRVDGLRVAARTSSFALRGAGLNARAMGESLRVATLLEGSVRRADDRVRVNVQLVDAAQGYQIWSRTYDRRIEDVIALQNDIASAIVSALQLRLVARGATPAARVRSNQEAYDLYLRGIYARNRLTGEELRKASDYFDRALRLDSTFAPAYAGKATTTVPLMWFGHLPPEQGTRMMRAAARRAVELDESLDEAHVALGMIAFFLDRDWPAAERAFRRAIAVNPNGAHAHHFLANFLKAMGRVDEAIAERQIALELDPLSVRTSMLLGSDYFTAGHYELAAKYYARASEIDPRSPIVLGQGPGVDMGLGHVYERQRRYVDAIREYLRVDSLSGVPTAELTQLRQTFERAGLRGYWRRRVESVLRDTSTRADPVRVAWMWARAGQAERAVRSLERAYDERSLGLVFLRVLPDFVDLHSEPRVRAILEAMHLDGSSSSRTQRED
jgi:adenylate cyclase